MHATNLHQQRGQRGSLQACKTDRFAETLTAGRVEAEKANSMFLPLLHIPLFCKSVESMDGDEEFNTYIYLCSWQNSSAGWLKAGSEMKSSTLIFTFKSGSTPLLVGRRQGVRRGVKHLFLLLQLAPHLCWLVEGRVWDKEFNIYFYLYSCPHSFVGWRYTDRQPCCPPQCTGNQKDNWQSHRLMPLWSSYLHCSPLVVKKKKGGGKSG